MEFNKNYISTDDDPKAPIFIPHNRLKPRNDRLLIYSTYRNNEKENKLNDTIKSLHAAWDIIYDIHKQKIRLEKQLEEANALMSEYKQKFGNLSDDDVLNDDDEESDQKKKTNKNHFGIWMTLSTILISAAIFGSAYYLKR